MQGTLLRVFEHAPAKVHVKIPLKPYHTMRTEEQCIASRLGKPRINLLQQKNIQITAHNVLLQGVCIDVAEAAILKYRQHSEKLRFFSQTSYLHKHTATSQEHSLEARRKTNRSQHSLVTTHLFQSAQLDHSLNIYISEEHT